MLTFKDYLMLLLVIIMLLVISCAPSAKSPPHNSQAERSVVVQNPEVEVFMAEDPMKAADYSSPALENSAQAATYALDNAAADKPSAEIDNSSQSLLKDLQTLIGIRASSANVPNNCLAAIDDQQQRRERLHYLIDNAPDDGCIEVLLRQLRQQ